MKQETIDSSPTMASSSAADAMLQAPVPSVHWLQCIELGYDGAAPKEAPVCFHCGKSDVKLSQCAKCNVAGYCSRECQVKDWKSGAGGGHKYSCQAYARAGVNMQIDKEEDKSLARKDVFTRIRFYACPFAVHKEGILGKGFLFVQSDCTLAELSLPIPKNSSGRPLNNVRACLLHYLTVGEYDSEVCRDDFELTEVRSKLQEAVDAYDCLTSVVLLMRFRCGHVALGVAPLVPDYSISKSLGKDYFELSTAGALQLNLDDL
jgi:hypothetical protein